jgi:hypothetical protein
MPPWPAPGSVQGTDMVADDCERLAVTAVRRPRSRPDSPRTGLSTLPCGDPRAAGRRRRAADDTKVTLMETSRSPVDAPVPGKQRSRALPRRPGGDGIAGLRNRTPNFLLGLRVDSVNRDERSDGAPGRGPRARGGRVSHPPRAGPSRGHRTGVPVLCSALRRTDKLLARRGAERRHLPTRISARVRQLRARGRPGRVSCG